MPKRRTVHILYLKIFLSYQNISNLNASLNISSFHTQPKLSGSAIQISKHIHFKTGDLWIILSCQL